MRARRLALSALVFAALAGVIGFFAFAASVTAARPDAVAKADGVVALTGGADRIAAALTILKEGRARRLLITGVNSGTSDADLVRVFGHGELFQCCVDVDRRALNTVGNADEAVAWARANAFSALIVVTASYHMPRAIVEIRRATGSLDLFSHPVKPEIFHPERWWADGQSLRILIAEYGKLVVATLRGRFFPKHA